MLGWLYAPGDNRGENAISFNRFPSVCPEPVLTNHRECHKKDTGGRQEKALLSFHTEPVLVVPTPEHIVATDCGAVGKRRREVTAACGDTAARIAYSIYMRENCTFVFEFPLKRNAYRRHCNWIDDDLPRQAWDNHTVPTLLAREGQFEGQYTPV